MEDTIQQALAAGEVPMRPDGTIDLNELCSVKQIWAIGVTKS